MILWGVTFIILEFVRCGSDVCAIWRQGDFREPRTLFGDIYLIAYGTTDFITDALVLLTPIPFV